MDKYIYTDKDFDRISWERIDKYMDKIYQDVCQFLVENKLSIRYVVPILRGGGIPAVILAHKFNVVDMLPVQLKYVKNEIDEKIKIDMYKNAKLNSNECILLVEGNHVTGKTANRVKDMLVNKFGENVNIIYVSITKDYSYKDSLGNIIYSTCGLYTNESKKLTLEECSKLGIDYKKVSLYPWEDIEEELEAINR